MSRKYETNPRYQKFVNEILDDVILANPKVNEDYRFIAGNGQFTFFTTVGVIDFYAGSDRMCIRDKNPWCNNGLVEIFKALGINPSGKDNSRYQKLYDYMSKEHNVNLTESEMQEIISIVKRIK